MVDVKFPDKKRYVALGWPLSQVVVNRIARHVRRIFYYIHCIFTLLFFSICFILRGRSQLSTFMKAYTAYAF